MSHDLHHRAGLEQPFRTPQRLRARSISHFERPCCTETAEQPFRTPLPFRAPLRYRGELEQLFRASLRFRAASGCHFEHPAAASHRKTENQSHKLLTCLLPIGKHEKKMEIGRMCSSLGCFPCENRAKNRKSVACALHLAAPLGNAVQKNKNRLRVLLAWLLRCDACFTKTHPLWDDPGTMFGLTDSENCGFSPIPIAMAYHYKLVDFFCNL